MVILGYPPKWPFLGGAPKMVIFGVPPKWPLWGYPKMTILGYPQNEHSGVPPNEHLGGPPKWSFWGTPNMVISGVPQNDHFWGTPQNCHFGGSTNWSIWGWVFYRGHPVKVDKNVQVFGKLADFPFRQCFTTDACIYFLEQYTRWKVDKTAILVWILLCVTHSR